MSSHPGSRMGNVRRRPAQSTNPDPPSTERLADPLCESISFDDSVLGSDSHSLNLSRQPSSPPDTTAPRPKHPMRYAFSQVFGETLNDPHAYITYGDLISAVHISPDAKMIAAGDMAGRIVVLSRTSVRSQRRGRTRYRNDSLRAIWPPVAGAAMNSDFDSACSDDNDDDFRYATPERPCYDFILQYFAHDSHLDYFYNSGIDESVTALCWAPGAASQTLISTSGAEVKVWRVQEKKITRLISMNPSEQYLRRKRQVPSPSQPLRAFHCEPKSTTHNSLIHNSLTHNSLTHNSPTHNSFLKFPRLELERYSTTATVKCNYNVGLVSIHSLSLSSDSRVFLVADEYRIDFLSLEHYNYKMRFLNMDTGPVKPVCEGVVAASFHPNDCNLFAYADVKTVLNLFDLRDHSTMKRPVSRYEEPKPGRKHSSFFSAMASNISDFKFSRTGPSVLTRDYMNLRLWDMRMERAPVIRIPVHENLRSRMCDLFQNDCFRDKFECCFSSDGGSLLTGSYNGMFQAFSAEDGSCSATEANLDTISGLSGRQHFSPEGLSASLHANASVPELVDETKRVIKLDASRDEDIVAVAAGPGIFVYQGVTD